MAKNCIYEKSKKEFFGHIFFNNGKKKKKFGQKSQKKIAKAI